MIERIRIGTRTSRLALVQCRIVGERLAEIRPDLTVELVHFSTRGDQTLDQPLPTVGGKGLFTAELEEALVRSDIDVAVHSLKDMPVAPNQTVTIGAILSREDARDCLVAKHGWTLDSLPKGAVIGTSSPRRQAQLLVYRPDLNVVSVRGNVETRIRHALEGEYDAVVLAYAGLLRLGLTSVVTQVISFDTMLPAPGQAALAVQCRSDDRRVLSLLAQIDDAATRAATDAERHFLERLGGGCSAPIGAYASRLGRGSYEVAVFAAGADRRQFVRLGRGPDPMRVSSDLAEQAKSYFANTQPSSAMQSNVHHLPLDGRRIVITRPEHQTEEFAQALARKGAQPILAPAIKITPVADRARIRTAISNLAEYRWILFTSTNAFHTFRVELERAGFDTSILANFKIAAVGSTTQQALDDAGVQCDFVPGRYTGSDLAQGLDIVVGDKILAPRSAIASPELPAILTRRGAIVDDIPIYETVRTELDDLTIQALEDGLDVLTFTSGSAVANFFSTLSEHVDLENLLKQTTVACIGPKTAEVLEKCGKPADIVAEAQTIDGLVDAIVNYYLAEPRDLPKGSA